MNRYKIIDINIQSVNRYDIDANIESIYRYGIDTEVIIISM